jgi:hypothetical protein
MNQLASERGTPHNAAGRPTASAWVANGSGAVLLAMKWSRRQQTALIAEAFTPPLRYSGVSPGCQLASVIAGGPAPLIATALSFHLRVELCDRALYLSCAAVSLASAAFIVCKQRVVYPNANIAPSIARPASLSRSLHHRHRRYSVGLVLAGCRNAVETLVPSRATSK